MKDFSEETKVPAYSIPTAFADLFQKGMVKAADFQKLALDLYARQTADAIRAWKRMLPAKSWLGILFFDAADYSLNTIVEVQRGLVDLLSQKSLAGTRQFQAAVPVEDLGGRDAAATASEVPDRITEHINRTQPSAAGQEKVLMVAMQRNAAAQTEVKSSKVADKRQSSAKKALRKGRY
jgi:hypothetical protein